MCLPGHAKVMFCLDVFFNVFNVHQCEVAFITFEMLLFHIVGSMDTVANEE